MPIDWTLVGNYGLAVALLYGLLKGLFQAAKWIGKRLLDEDKGLLTKLAASWELFMTKSVERLDAMGQDTQETRAGVEELVVLHRSPDSIFATEKLGKRSAVIENKLNLLIKAKQKLVQANISQEDEKRKVLQGQAEELLQQALEIVE